jgi:hypothetical protein
MTLGLSLDLKISGCSPTVGTEGLYFLSTPALNSDGFNVGWCSVADVDNACFGFLLE